MAPVRSASALARAARCIDAARSSGAEDSATASGDAPGAAQGHSRGGAADAAALREAGFDVGFDTLIVEQAGLVGCDLGEDRVDLIEHAVVVEEERDLVAGVRDYQQSKIANDQNEVMKKLTAIASMLLLPTLIVGLYGQNFKNIPELHWGWGYYWSLGLIALTSLGQFVYFRRKGWL